MKILTLSINFPSAAAPTQGVFVKERLRYLAKHSEVKVISPVPWFPFLCYLKPHGVHHTPAVEMIDGLEVWRPRFFYIPGIFKGLDGFFLFLSVLPTVMRIRKNYPFDLVDAHFVYPDGFAGILLGKLFCVPVSVTLRGTIVAFSKFYIRRRLIRWTLKRASHIFAVAKFLKSVAVSIGIPENAIRFSPNGIDACQFYPVDRQKARSNLGLPPHGRILISVGSLTERKGYHHIIPLLPDLLEKYPDLLYLVVGGATAEGDYSGTLRRQVEQLGLERHVLFAGPKPHHELREWLSASDLFCLATQNEGWANVFLEAMACGLPVVATDVGGNREVIVSQEVGFLTPYGDGQRLRDAINDALEKNWDRKAIAAYAHGYSWEEVAGKILKVFEGRDQ